MNGLQGNLKNYFLKIAKSLDINQKTMTDIKKRKFKKISLLLVAMLSIGFASCEKTQSYSEMLREEEKAVNSFLAEQKVALEIPADSTSFETGSDAPFYRLDEDGYVYMQVISKGDSDSRVKEGDMVYFRFTRKNLLTLYQTGEAEEEGNSNDFGGSFQGNPYFIYEDKYITNSIMWGTGIQMPLEFFGYNSEVNLVLRSYYGFKTDQSNCLPYIINLRYFKPEY